MTSHEELVQAARRAIDAVAANKTVKPEAARKSLDELIDHAAVSRDLIIDNSKGGKR